MQTKKKTSETRVNATTHRAKQHEIQIIHKKGNHAFDYPLGIILTRSINYFKRYMILHD